MNTSEVLLEVRNRTVWLTMNRPKVLNALSKEMFRELRLGLARGSESDQVRFIVITGAGGSFSAGLDIKQVGGFASKYEAKRFVFQIVKPFWAQLFDCNKPVVSVVDGPAYGAGAEIALASDIVIASDRSRFAFSGGRVGALCCISGLIGPFLMQGRKLHEMNLTGNPISAEEAKNAGLVNHVVSRENVMDKATSVLDDLGNVSPISNSSFKRIRKSVLSARSLSTAYQQLFATITSPDFRKGSKAFLAKETPRY